MQLESHRLLISDFAAQEAFRKAIFDTIQGGEVVLDLGTGAGIHAVFACQAGAKRVYAIERDSIIEFAEEICFANGYSDRVSFIHEDVNEIEIPERVDVVVTHQSLENLFRLFASIRDRFVNNGAVLIPKSIEVFCIPLEAPDLYEDRITFWENRHFGVSLAPGRLAAINSIHTCRIEPAQALGDSVRLASFDLADVHEPNIAGEFGMRIERPGILHGIGIWFKEYLTDDIVLSTVPPIAPLSPQVWAHGFLPISQPVPVESSGCVSLSLHTGRGGWGSLWKWGMVVRDRNGRQTAESNHSTLYGWPLTKKNLRKQALDYVPGLTPRGSALRFVLESCDGSRSLSWIETEVLSRFPQLFRNHPEAAVFVADAVGRYST